MAQPHISVAAETIITIGSFPITNSLISTWIVMAFLFSFAFFVGKNLKDYPNRFQVFIEFLFGGMYEFFRKLGGKHGDKFAPLIVTFFFFIVISNWFGLLPGVGTIGIVEKYQHQKKQSDFIIQQAIAATNQNDKLKENGGELPEEYKSALNKADKNALEKSHGDSKFIPLFRAPTADLNMTLGLGIIAFFAIQYFGLSIGGLSYLKRFLDFRNPIYFFVGMLEVISEISKILSFGFRLFGNIFAGEVLLTIMAFLFAFLLPVPFYGLEVFVGLIQGLVFAMLTAVFITIAISHVEHANHAHQESA